ncbi:ATP-dependent DNA ligase [Alkalihalophilus marmarensis DSM 21297]|uniref:ATP-dependent DNA ligase n=1 Tax=Alkalihalophilus marmarensis DSM 21297 TaxID=1188261 RepID=U6SQM8_9BACI|nr:ATP-dependent DNA ligase [Alkalihalophilus marmarensis DSM 21297]
MVWENETPRLYSRNEKELTANFPEVIEWCRTIYEQVKEYLPLMLDGELVHLLNPFKSEFTLVQQRGKFRTKETITRHSRIHPMNFIIFDLLKISGTSLMENPLSTRKKQLDMLCKALGITTDTSPLQIIETFKKGEELFGFVTDHNGEGLVAKKKTSTYRSTRSKDWLKIKNWRYVQLIVTAYDKRNGYFEGSVLKDGELTAVTHFKHGMKDEEYTTLTALFKQNGEKRGKETWTLTPSIVVSIACIGFDGKQLREPKFNSFLMEAEPDDCTWNSLQRQLHPIPKQVEITHPDKPVWPSIHLVKDDYLLYLQKAAPFLLPFLQDRLLTVIRFPHGADDESFYQKNTPDYAPSFIQTAVDEDIEYILCNDLKSLMWLGNQLALEFHIPYQTIHQTKPAELVFDLDPPSVDEFELAVQAALQMKEIFDQFHLTSYVKTSGNKGLQLYLPLPVEAFSYKQTRAFSEFVSIYLCEQNPETFTIERLKKNRGGRLYIDYIQHDAGKTIIAPYSTRGHGRGLVATPLYWEEVGDKLTPDDFTIPRVIERLRSEGDPFRNMRENLDEQGEAFAAVLRELKKLGKK